jgi:UDP-2-acetamido-2,6-beta-L-arabino-hexul-4-ose reductase
MTHSIRRILVTGAKGFIGKNLITHLNDLSGFTIMTFNRGDEVANLPELIAEVDVVVHLAGENRPADEDAFQEVNTGLTVQICEAIKSEIKVTGRYVPLILTSSAQAELDNPYGRSKLAAEQSAQSLANKTCNPVAIYRLPGVFGKWCKPNYNSVVATFCYNKARDLTVNINDDSARVRLVYIDDVVRNIIEQLSSIWLGVVHPVIQPEHNVTIGELSQQIDAFKNCRSNLVSERVGTGFIRALYATYVSYLPVDKFAYSLPAHTDERGVFVEMLKTLDSGQFSFFTAHPGVTRGGHYHHTKTEKFLVIKGNARFGFRHILTNEMHHIETNGDQPQIVETVPGWTHDITNIGKEEMVVMLWANEIFDRATPDTILSKV